MEPQPSSASNAPSIFESPKELLRMQSVPFNGSFVKMVSSFGFSTSPEVRH